MKWIFTAMIALSVLTALLTGRMDAVSNAALQECGSAVELTLTLMGSMCLWSGLMKIMERAGLTERISRLFAPLLRVLFKGLDQGGAAARAIVLSLSANLLGLGNAATPLGVAAMKALEKENGGSASASDHMVLFVVLNTVSLQLLPTTIAMLRASAGASAPLDILPAIWLASLCSVLAAVAAAKWLARLFPPGPRAGLPPVGGRARRP